MQRRVYNRDMESGKRDIYSLDKLRTEIKNIKEKISRIKPSSNTLDLDFGNGFGKLGVKKKDGFGMKMKILSDHAPDPNFEIVKFQGINLNLKEKKVNEKLLKAKSKNNKNSSLSGKFSLDLNKNSGLQLKSSISCSQKSINTENNSISQRDLNKDKIAPLKSILKHSNTFTSIDLPQESNENSHLFAEISALKNENRKLLSKITKLTSGVGIRMKSARVIGKGGGNKKKDKNLNKVNTLRYNCRSIGSTSISESELLTHKSKKSKK